jgi:zinc transport system substrate-binding protein
LLRQNRTVIIIAVALSLILSACGSIDPYSEKSPDEGLIIVTSFYPMYVFTINIAHDIPGVKVINMTEPQTGCLHDYQLVPADMKTLEQADIFVINGAGMESFLDKVISQLPELDIIEASEGIQLLKDINGEDNPHVWVSISGAIQEVKNITEGLARLDPGNADLYRKNSKGYIEKLEKLKDKMHDELRNIKTRDIVTFHEAFPYFAQEFDLNIVSVVEREPGSEPSAGELAETIRAINEAQVKVLFAEPQYSAKAAEAIANETGAKVYILDPVVTGPKDAAPDSYEKTMEENLKVLTEALYD